MNTHETYVSLETARLLKEAGFNWEIRSLYDEQNYFVCSLYGDWNNVTICKSAPTLDVAQRWLREVKECAVIVMTHNVQAACVTAYVYCIYPTNGVHPCKHVNGFAEDQCFDTYEQALEAGIKKALEIISEKGE